MHLAIAISEELAAAALFLLTAPLFLDLGIALAGNLRRPRAAREGVARSIRLAVVVPAHDEAAMIARTVRSLLAAGCSPGPECERTQDPWKVPVFVVAHNCSDATAMLAEAAGARVLKLNDPRRRGKGAALRFGLAAARRGGANAFLVIDADSIAGAHLIHATRAALARGAEAVQCRYELERPPAPFTSPARLRVMAFRGINVLRPRGRAQLGFSAGIFGNGFAVTEAALLRAPFAADSICEDLEYHAALVSAGLRVAWVDEAVVWAPLSAPGRGRAAQEARWEGGRLHVAARATTGLLRAAAAGNWRALDALAEAWSLPLSRGVAALLAAALLPLPWLHVYALLCGLLAALYVLAAAALGGEPGPDLAALAAVPAHLAWKIRLTPRVLRHARPRMEWVRTEREAPRP